MTRTTEIKHFYCTDRADRSTIHRAGGAGNYTCTSTHSPVGQQGTTLRGPHTQSLVRRMIGWLLSCPVSGDIDPKAPTNGKQILKNTFSQQQEAINALMESKFCSLKKLYADSGGITAAEICRFIKMIIFLKLPSWVNNVRSNGLRSALHFPGKGAETQVKRKECQSPTTFPLV